MRDLFVNLHNNDIYFQNYLITENYCTAVRYFFVERHKLKEIFCKYPLNLNYIYNIGLMAKKEKKKP